MELNSLKEEVTRAQNTLKQKEEEEQRLQGNINQLKQLAEQKKKQIEALQGEVKNAVSQKVLMKIDVYLFSRKKKLEVKVKIERFIIN